MLEFGKVYLKEKRRRNFEKGILKGGRLLLVNFKAKKLKFYFKWGFCV